jgi:gamma-glutamyl hydrolase
MLFSWYTSSLGVLVVLNVVAGDTPVFGILSQPIKDSNETMIAASYVKWLEAGGARSIPIPYDASEDLVEEIFSQIDGVFLPGGGSDLPPAAVHLWKYVRTAHSIGDAIPIWGTCLGFEFLLQLAAHNTSILESGYNAENISLPLEQVVSHQLYRPRKLVRDVRTRNITMNNHELGLSPEKFFRTPQLTKLWKVTSINHDRAGRPFVSTIEPIEPNVFPVYGVQFHPEKNSFEYATFPHSNIPYEAIDHSKEGIQMSLYMATFVADLARRNPAFGKFHSYDDPDRFPLVYSYEMKRGIQFEQTFRIPPASHWDTEEISSEDNQSLMSLW